MSVGFKHILFIVSLFFASKIFSEGFPAGTFVKAVGRHVPIEKLQIGDGVYCCNAAGMPVAVVQSRETEATIHLFLNMKPLPVIKNNPFSVLAMMPGAKQRTWQLAML